MARESIPHCLDLTEWICQFGVIDTSEFDRGRIAIARNYSREIKACAELYGDGNPIFDTSQI